MITHTYDQKCMKTTPAEMPDFSARFERAFCQVRTISSLQLLPSLIGIKWRFLYIWLAWSRVTVTRTIQSEMACLLCTSVRYYDLCTHFSLAATLCSTCSCFSFTIFSLNQEIFKIYPVFSAPLVHTLLKDSIFNMTDFV